MPAPSRWMIRCSFIYLILGFLLGAVLLAHKALDLHPGTWALLPVHIEMMIFGWIIQLTLGTAYWILPRFLQGPQRGKKLPAILMVLTLNTGILCVITGSLTAVDFHWEVTGRVLELAAVGIFVSLHWNRVVTYRTEAG